MVSRQSIQWILLLSCIHHPLRQIVWLSMSTSSAVGTTASASSSRALISQSHSSVVWNVYHTGRRGTVHTDDVVLNNIGTVNIAVAQSTDLGALLKYIV